MVLLATYVIQNIMAGAAHRAGNAHYSGALDFTLGFPVVRDIRFTIDFTTDLVYCVHGLRLLLPGFFRRYFPFYSTTWTIKSITRTWIKYVNNVC